MDIKFLVILSTVLSLTSCATPTKTPKLAPSPDATIQLAEAASSVSHSLSDLAVVERATAPRPHRPLPAVSSYPGMDNLVSIDWSGPVGPLVQRLAAAADYRYRVLGTPPAIPAIVTINTKNTQIGDVLRDAAYQSGKKISIFVMPSTKVIELRYHNG